MRVLVTAASKHGATAEIADVVAGVLEDAGLHVDRCAPSNITDLTPYDAVVVGSAVYAGRWVREATALLDRLGDQLAARPLWVFSSGPLGDPPTPTGLPPVADTAVARLRPRDHRAFAGALDREGLSLAERAVVRAVRAPYGDFRDWDAVREWAVSIVDGLEREAWRRAATAPVTPTPTT